MAAIMGQRVRNSARITRMVILIRIFFFSLILGSGISQASTKIGASMALADYYSSQTYLDTEELNYIDVMPGAKMEIEGRQLNGSGAYVYSRRIYESSDQENTGYHSFNGSGNLKLFHNQLQVNGAGSVGRYIENPQASTSALFSTRDNLTEVWHGRIGSTFNHQLSSNVAMRAGYNQARTYYRYSSNPSSRNDLYQFGFNNDSPSARLNWSIDYRKSSTLYEGGEEGDMESYELSLSRHIARTIRVALNVGDAKNYSSTAAINPDFGSGIFKKAYLIWTPNTRSQTKLGYVGNPWGESADLSFSHRMRRIVLNAGFQESMTVGSMLEPDGDYVDVIGEDGAVEQNLALPQFTIRSGFFVQRMGTAGLAYEGRRVKSGLAYKNERRTFNDGYFEMVDGINIDVAVDLGKKTTTQFTAVAQEVSYDVSGKSTRRYAVALDGNFSIGKNLLVTARISGSRSVSTTEVEPRKNIIGMFRFTYQI